MPEQVPDMLAAQLEVNAMPTPEEQRQCSMLSGTLQQLGHTFARSLPPGTASLHLQSREGQVRLDAYDRTGKVIGTLPNDETPAPFREAIERLAKEKCPDPDGIICPL